MADEPTEGEAKPKKMLLMNILVSSVLGFVCGGLGFALFTFVLPSGSDSSDAAEVEAAEDSAPAFVPFGEVVVNLADQRMSRYLRLNITMQVKTSDSEQATADVETHKAILRNWLLGYLSNLQLEDIRGASGQNRIRREIQNYFNEVLSADGVDVVQDILFEDFTVQ